MDRLRFICDLCNAHGIDIICLQEVPQADLGPGTAPGPLPVGSTAHTVLSTAPSLLSTYTAVRFPSENSPNAPAQTTTTDGYLVLFKTAAYPGGASVVPAFAENQLHNRYGLYLRPPMGLDLDDGTGGPGLRVLTWHAEVGPGAGLSLEILDAVLPMAKHIATPTILAGDFNARGDFGGIFGAQQNFVGWTNCFAVYPVGTKTVNGLDHVLTSMPSTPILGGVFDFTSDAYHFPLAVNF